MTQIISINKARTQLEAAQDLNEVQSIRDKAEALRQYARQANWGLDKQNHCAEIKIRAERRCGQLLKKHIQHGGDRRSGSRFDHQTLKQLDIKKGQSFRWQSIAEIPDELFENHIANLKKRRKELTSADLLRVAKDYRKKQKSQMKADALSNLPPGVGCLQLYEADFRTVAIVSESIDAIITDPPYSREYLPLYRDLALFSADVLKPGGSLLVMSGLAYLPEILSLMATHLNYQWTLACFTPGATYQMWQKKVMSGWKPVLWFVKGQYQGDWIKDTAVSDGLDKRFHFWGQSESGMADLIEKFTIPGQTVLDPMCGGGTVGAVSLKMGRKFIGIDLDRKAIETTRTRIGNVYLDEHLSFQEDLKTVAVKS